MRRDEAGLARRARLVLHEAEQLLVNPRAPALDAAVPHLDEAAKCLAAIEEGLRQREDGPALRAEMDEVRRAVARVSALLDSAVVFYCGWARLLCAAASGYTAGGKRAAPPAVRSLSVEG